MRDARGNAPKIACGREPDPCLSHLWVADYFVSENVQVPVALRLIPPSSAPTQGGPAGEIVTVSGPERDVAVAARVPMPVIEHASNP